jgi:anti-anti-sigma factor
MALLSVGHESEDDAIIVRATGEVDTSTVDDLTAALTAAVRAAETHPARLVIVDLQQVNFFGSAGLNAVFDCHQVAAVAGTVVRLVADHGPVLQPLRVTELDRVLDIRPTLLAALQ